MKMHLKIDARPWREEGFTLIELIIVVAVLAILAAVAVPSYVRVMDNSRKTADVNNAIHLVETTKKIIVQDHRFSGLTGSWTITETDVTPIGASSADFGTELENQISVGQLVPKYSGVFLGGGADRFILEVIFGTVYDIKVSVSDGTDNKEIYPNLDPDYKVK